jgi:hypothetical protein
VNTITFAIVYVGCFLIYTIAKLPLTANQGLNILMLGTLVWAVFYIWLYICRRWPLAGWFLFGFISGLLGGRGRRRW